MWAKLEQKTAYEELQKQKESENKYAGKGRTADWQSDYK